MKYIAAYLLLTLGGKTDPTAEDIKGLFDTVGIEAETERLEKLISELKGKDINELIVEGQSKLASVPSAGAVAVSSGAGAATGGAAATEEKKEEEKEESDDDMGFGLFD